MAKEVIGVKFRTSGKTYYFSPKDVKFEKGDGVVTETARGMEYGTVVTANHEVPDNMVVAPLKEIVRKATKEDQKRHDENVAKRENLMKVGQEKIAEKNLEMKLVDAEYTFDRQKIIYYFTAAGRVDFRELVKELASVFHVRIELRQIYERDDIKMRGALAACGRPCCCTLYLRDFEKVSIKMAKIQGLSLNPTKISGSCGRLMCCLKFENAYYQEAFGQMPKVNTTATTPDGEGTVVSNNLLKRECNVRVTLKDGSQEVRTYKLEDINAKVKQNESEITETSENEEE